MPETANGYWPRLAQRVAQWAEKHPADYAAILETARTACGIFKDDAFVSEARQRVIDAQVTEAIRMKNGWPSEADFLKTQTAGAVALGERTK